VTAPEKSFSGAVAVFAEEVTMTSPSCPPVAPTAGPYGPWLEACGAAAQGAADLFTASLGRWPRPFDVGRWLDVMAERRPPRWATAHELVFESPLARLRDYSVTGGRRGLVPTLVLPPQAGHDSCIVDFSPEQSQMGAIRESGLTRAFTLDWAGATEATAGATVEDYLDVIDRAVDHCGGRVNLIGDCQGGWLATIYATQATERVNTLTIAGAPIDFSAGQPVIGSVLNTLTPGRDLAFYEWLVASGGGVLRGRHMLNGFMVIGPGAEISRQLELLVHVDESAHVDRYRVFEDWFKHTQDIPGEFYLWIVRHLFMNNELIAGDLEVRGERVDLGRLKMPLNLLAGATDHITPPDQVYALADYASTAPEDIVRRLSTGGHLGLFMGHEALAEQWPPLLAAVLERSLPRRRSSAAGE
jgi:poly(3-hydroxyalkanoate) synthetase